VGFLGASVASLAPADPTAHTAASGAEPAAAVTGTPGGAPDGHTKRLRLADRFGAAFSGLGRGRFWPARFAAAVLEHSLQR
jgi:hypothetical protein